MEFFRKLSIRQKVILCMVWPLLGFFYYCGTNYVSESNQAKLAGSIHELIEISKETIKVIDQLQQEREASIHYMVSRSDNDKNKLLNIHQTNDVAFRKYRVNILPLVDRLQESLLKAELESIEKIFENLSSDQDLSIGVNNQIYLIRGKVENFQASLGEVLQV